MRKGFGIRELAEWAKKEGAIDLAQGTIDSPPPAALLAALKNLELEKCSTYNNKRGVLLYREAIREYLATRGWRCELGQILGTAGVMGATVAALLADLRPGETVLLPEPFFIGHKLMLEALGMRIIYAKVPLNDPPDWNELEEAMENVAAVLLTTPANPTGQVASLETLKYLSEAAVHHNCLLLIDEVYRMFNWQEKQPDDSEYTKLDFGKTVVMRSFSKALAIPGWRVGFAVTTSDRMEKMAARHDALYIGASTIAQNAVAEALTTSLGELNEYMASLRQVVQGNIKILADAFRAAGMEPAAVRAGTYMIIKHRRANDRAAMEEMMAKKIALVPLNILFSDRKAETGYIRAHVGIAREKAIEVATRLKGK